MTLAQRILCRYKFNQRRVHFRRDSGRIACDFKEDFMPGEKILIVDDDQDFAQLLEFDLKKKGFQTLLTHNGEEGLAKAINDKPALILLDIKMPKMDGYTFVRRLKKEADTKEIPIIVLTSYEPMKDMFQLEGVNDYFVKSVNMDGLLKTIEKNLQAPKKS